MNLPRTNAERVFTVFNTLFMCFLVIATLYPMWYILCSSLSEPEYIYSNTNLIVWPMGWNISSYVRVITNPAIITGYMNTIFVVAVGTTCNIFMSILGGFVLSRRNFMIKRGLSLFIVFTMFFQGGLIPSYLVVQWVGLIDSRWALIVPGVISTFNMIIVRTNFAAFPLELEDASRVDGANELVLLARIMLPVCKPVIAVVTLFYATGHWNAWLSSVLYLRTRTLYPLQLILREILIANNVQAMSEGIDILDNLAVMATIKYASIIVSTLPILCFYPFIQKYFVKGVMIGAVKG